MTTRGRISRITLATFKRFSQVFSTRPSGISSACRHPTPRIFAASAASRARSSALPRVPISPCVKSRMPVRCPRSPILSSVPPQVCSTSSRCAAMARMSRGPEAISIQNSCVQNHILAHDQPVRSHFLQHWQDAGYIFICIHKDNNDRQLPTGLDHMRGFHSMPSQKSRYRMKSRGRVNIFLTQVVEDLHVQQPVVPLVGLIQINCDLHCHLARNSIAPGPTPCPPKPRPGTTDYLREC